MLGVSGVTEREVSLLHAPKQMELRLPVRMLMSSSSGQSSSASAIPLSSCRIDDGWPKTNTLRADRRPSLATSAAPMLLFRLSEPSPPRHRYECTLYWLGQAVPGMSDRGALLHPRSGGWSSALAPYLPGVPGGQLFEQSLLGAISRAWHSASRSRKRP